MMHKKSLIVIIVALFLISFAPVASAKIVLVWGDFSFSKAREEWFWTFTNGKGGQYLGIGFRVEEGGDIECFVIDENDVENWNKGRSVKAYYNSGRVKDANVIISLPGDRRYYVVFTNRDSAVLNKKVCAHVMVGTNETEIKRTLTEPLCVRR